MEHSFGNIFYMNNNNKQTNYTNVTNGKNGICVCIKDVEMSGSSIQKGWKW